jgi:chromosome segregation ATPase
MKENTPKYLSELLKNETLKEPLKESLMLLAMKYDSSYHFFEAMKKEFQNNADGFQKKTDELQQMTVENLGLIRLLQQEMEKQNAEIRTLQENLKQFENVQIELNGIREELQEVKQKEKEMEAEIISLKEQIEKKEPEVEIEETVNERFVIYNNRTILDKQTQLMWASEDNGEYANWETAKNWCENFNAGGYNDWRLPKTQELKELCKHLGRLKNYMKIRHENLWISDSPIPTEHSQVKNERLWFPKKKMSAQEMAKKAQESRNESIWFLNSKTSSQHFMNINTCGRFSTSGNYTNTHALPVRNA